MVSTEVFTILYAILAPGESGGWRWNNPAEYSVHTIWVEPYGWAFSEGPSVTRLEVRDIAYVSNYPGGIGVARGIEFTVKNTGSKSELFQVMLAVHRRY